ncbi:hypothetical protein LEP1GSC192_2806 [Leptospira sp. B5-022]|nr:hypothetical protein LEP1GSC192_2806 [Leptospira sp. B5-022]
MENKNSENAICLAFLDVLRFGFNGNSKEFRFNDVKSPILGSL